MEFYEARENFLSERTSFEKTAEGWARETI
jgi:hypothetical protein